MIDSKIFEPMFQQSSNHQVFDSFIFEGNQIVKQRILNWLIKENEDYVLGNVTNSDFCLNFQMECNYTECKISKCFETVKIKSRIEGRNDLAEQIKGLNYDVNLVNQMYCSNINLNWELMPNFGMDERIHFQKVHSISKRKFYDNQMKIIAHRKNCNDSERKKYLDNADSEKVNDTNNENAFSMVQLAKNRKMKLLPFNLKDYILSKRIKQKYKNLRRCYFDKSNMFNKIFKKSRASKKIKNCERKKISQFVKNPAGKTEAEHMSNVAMLNSRQSTSSIYSNDTNISNVLSFNNEAVSVENITYNLNFYKNFNEENTVFTSDFETHKAEPEKTIDDFQYRDFTGVDTLFTPEETKNISDTTHDKTKNAACQTESLSEL
ncbi:hypothetical protein TNIN_233171 [Trichonephila inaurata madagascariensis]|uniref:Uncharacterized protein n=1 Tax=Trichonephila inaurata madagascariensis TaxID=2747483 RepID=A0A8X6J941_9ARAC|nr:hypothetical protein TNIN_233171 [Trichonephila inaurata madagascariensis]